ncbi:MAG: hypothetical protein ABIN67_13825 [Ferruginibacter sp.]
MKKINLDFEIIDLDGKLTGQKVGKALANILAIQSKGDPLKFMTWAMAFNAGQTVELDPTDIQTLKTFVSENEQMTNFLKYPILTLL